MFQTVGGLTPGRAYVISAWVASSTGATARAKFFVDNGQQQNASQRLMTPNATWQRVSLLYTADATGNVAVALERQAGTGTLYWDDIQIEVSGS